MTTAIARKQGLSSQIRDCLAHFHDVPYLQQHPLAGVVAQRPPAAARSQGHALQEWLRAATESLRPDVPEIGRAHV